MATIGSFSELAGCSLVCASFIMVALPQRSQVIRRNQDGKARSGRSSAPRAVGSGSVP
jgi:hypothetical protein